MDNNNYNKLKEYNSIYREMNNLYHDIALKLEISDSTFSVFYTICELGNGCLQKDICETFFISKQTINSCIKKLEKEDYIYLKQGKGKDKHIFLTKKGEELVTQKIMPILEMEKSIFAEMTEQESDMLLKLSIKYLQCFKNKVKQMLQEETI